MGISVVVWEFLDLCIFVVPEIHKKYSEKESRDNRGLGRINRKVVWCGVVWYPYFTPPSLRLSLLSSQGTLDISPKFSIEDLKRLSLEDFIAKGKRIRECP